MIVIATGFIPPGFSIDFTIRGVILPAFHEQNKARILKFSLSIGTSGGQNTKKQVFMANPDYCDNAYVGNQQGTMTECCVMINQTL